MNPATTIPAAPVTITRADAATSIFAVTGPNSIAIRAGTKLGVVEFLDETPLALPALDAGRDYYLQLDAMNDLVVVIEDGPPNAETIGGFHVAPFANATARAGGAAGPAINPYSCWDTAFRPACPDPRGMVMVDGRFWADIYLLGANHLQSGTSAFGTSIADGATLPSLPDAGKAKKLDFATAKAIYAHHGKQLLGAEEFFAAAYGVAERRSRNKEPMITGEPEGAPFVSRWGLIDVTGTMWQWGTDGDPDNPRASVFGGFWGNGDYAGSRYAILAYWPDSSGRSISARGRCDHLMLG